MRASILTPDAKDALRKRVRALRERLLVALNESARSEYQLDVSPAKARLPEARRCRRERLDAWLDEQTRAIKTPKGALAEARVRFFAQAVEEAAHTLLNRLVFLRILEHHDVVRPHVVTGGFRSAGYSSEFLQYAGPLAQDDAKGYRALLGVVFDELALELPGLFGPVGLTALFPVPAAVLRDLVEALNDPTLDSAWGDDTTLGWVYQYWNDPEREDLDAKISRGEKIEPHEIASKTQMFTERYMVEWLLQNSLGLMWLAICRKNGWPPDALPIIHELDQRREAWRKRRDVGEVALDALMPVAPGLESAWKYYVPQTLPQETVATAPASIGDVRLLDPACGSGHFLVIAFGLFAAMYEEEARHRREAWTAADIAQRIVAANLHGVDIDSRAVQIAAAAVWLTAKLSAPDARLAQMNLVAPSFRLAALPNDDPARVALVDGLFTMGIPRDTSAHLVESLAGVDYLGTLLRVDREISALIDTTEESGGPLFAHAAKKDRTKLNERVASFLDAHAAESDLGLRLEGEQLAAGVRFIEIVKEGRYDIVVGNPPYQGLSKTAGFEYVARSYPRGKADLYAAFLERGLELCRRGGLSAIVTMQGWMFLSQFTDLRRWILKENSLRAIGDLMWCAFENMRHATVVLSVTAAGPLETRAKFSVAVMPSERSEREESIPALARKRAALLAQVGRFEFDPTAFSVIEGEPIVHWWSREFLAKYAAAPKLGDRYAVRVGLQTSNNVRFLRKVWEVDPATVFLDRTDSRPGSLMWEPYVKGAAGRAWVEPLLDIILWQSHGLEAKVFNEYLYRSYTRTIKNERFYFQPAVTFSMIGAAFSARTHRFLSICDVMGSSVFTSELAPILTLLNSRLARTTLESLNPTIHFQAGDVARLPLLDIADAEAIYKTVVTAADQHEAAREPSVEFRQPACAAWSYTQEWAQRAVDRPEETPLPPFDPAFDEAAPESSVSFAVGVALGRFGADGEGILKIAPKTALPAGILFVGPSDAYRDSLTHQSVARVLAAWDAHLPREGRKPELRDWLRKDFFAYHKALYENRPIYFPLSSEKKTFVAWVSIHRWNDATLMTLLADHLRPVHRQLAAEIADVNAARASSDRKTAVVAERQYEKAKRLLDELDAFIRVVTECAERGAPPTDPACRAREVDATFKIELDDGVMINSAALWPLLVPQWSDPKKWWKQLCVPEGRKNYDWAHLARRYFPTRVDARCKDDPSLAVAHGCFWRYHPTKAFAWELRLHDEIRHGFTIDEPGSDEARADYLHNRGVEAEAAREKERVRRERKATQRDEEESEVVGDDHEVDDDA